MDGQSKWVCERGESIRKRRRRARWSALAVLCAALLCASPPARADFVQQGLKLVGDVNAFFGNAVALSADGNTAIVGERDYNSGAGAAVVFVRTNGVWTKQTGLLANNPIGSAQQGYAVALSADGNTALVGGPEDNGSRGAAWVFTRSGSSWTQQGKLIGTGANGLARQGGSVALSADGNTAIVGGPTDNDNGAAWVFTRTGGGWNQQGTKLVGDPLSSFGWSVALSADGNTAIVGEPTYTVNNSSIGAAVVFVRDNGSWDVQTGLLATGVVGAARQGYSVALSADGNTALVGGYGDNGGAGATWVFTRSGTAWTQQGSKLVGSGATGAANQGGRVALSADGNMAFVGGSADNGDAGATWIFTRNGTTWFQQGSKLVGAGATGTAGQGAGLALSADGNTALIGGPRDNVNSGAAWVFVRSRADTHDFNADRRSDILWRDTGGATAVWLMNGTGVTSAASLGTVAGWSVAGQRDFDGNGMADILWRDGSGNTAIWFMNGTAVASAASVGVIAPAWSVVGTGDMNGDGKCDLLWRDSSGNMAVWLMNGASVTAAASLGNVAPSFTVAAHADFNGDGKADILWRDGAGNTSIWFMDGTGVASAGFVGTVAPPWSVAATGDFNGDSKADILWRDTSGNTAIWLMSGASVASGGSIGIVAPPWIVAAIGDFGGDGRSDIVWRNTTTGATVIWFINGASVVTGDAVGNVPPSWTIQAANAN